MKPNELRLGNWIYVITNGNYEQIYNLHSEFGSFVEPILLTEEWFINFEFKKTTYGYESKEDFLEESIEIVKTENGYKLSVGFNNYDIGREFKYVHQLQNLYFSLTNEELKLNNE